mgnify:FL=1|tara:strand:- start:1228 stop:1743 length:516 start_codon:yes stop_codon:yes gene_type:complete
MKILRLFLFVVVTVNLTNCQKLRSVKDLKVDNIEFTYSSGLRIPYNKVNVNIFRTYNNQNAVAIIHCEPSSTEAKWAYSKIDTVIDIDTESFEKLAKIAISLENINLDKAFVEGRDGSMWKIEFGSKGKNISYNFWSPLSNSKERGLTEFVNLSTQILDKVKLNKAEIIEK